MNATSIEKTKQPDTLTLEIPLNADARGSLSAAATQLSWIVRNFLCSVCESYLHDAPRRVEAYNIAKSMVHSAEVSNQISEKDASDVLSEIESINREIYPGCSKS